MKPLVSIVVPNRNHGHTLPRLFDSILRQTLKEVEVVVSDDCSDIPYMDVLEAYRAKGLHIRFVTSSTRLYTKNARLAGIKAATADIIACADADDMLWGQEALEAHVRQFIDQKADVLQFCAVMTDANGQFSSYFKSARPFSSVLYGEDIFSCYLKNPSNNGVVWNKLYLRTLWLDLMDTAWNSRFYRYSEDIYLASLFLFHAKKYVGSEHIGYGWHWVDKRNADSGERAIYAYLMLEELLPYFIEHGCSHENAAAFRRKCLSKLRFRAGRFASITEGKLLKHTLQDMNILEFFDKKLLIKALIVGTRLNAETVVDIFHAMNLSGKNFSEDPTT